MKKVIFIMVIAFMMAQSIKATASGEAKQLELNSSYAGDPWGKPIKHSMRPIMQAFLSETHIILSPSAADSGYVCITICDSNGNEMKSETAVLIPGQDTLIYIVDLAAGTFELTIETDSYTLYGNFEVE